MFHFSIRDLLWLTVVVAVALLFVIEQRAHRKRIETLNARNDQSIRQRDGLRWQLMHAADELQAEGFTMQSDDKRFQLLGPSKHGYDSVTITRINNGEMLQIMSGDKDVTRNFTSPAILTATGAKAENDNSIAN